jgi:hypothetical protein
MLKKNSLPIGALIAFIFPAIACGVAYLLKDNTAIINRPALPYLVAVGANLVLMRICSKKSLDQTTRGIMITTFVFMLLIFAFVIRLKL